MQCDVDFWLMNIRTVQWQIEALESCGTDGISTSLYRDLVSDLRKYQMGLRLARDEEAVIAAMK